MAAVPVDRPLVCAACEAEIVGSPRIDLGRAFCCAGCAAGRPCECRPAVDDRSVRQCHDLADPIAFEPGSFSEAWDARHQASTHGPRAGTSRRLRRRQPESIPTGYR